PAPRSTHFPYTTLFRSLQLLEQRPVLAEGPLVQHQEAPVAHRQHVGVERAAVDARRILLGEERLGPGQPVQPRQGLARLPRLPRSEEHTSELQSRENLV